MKKLCLIIGLFLLLTACTASPPTDPTEAEDNSAPATDTPQDPVTTSRSTQKPLTEIVIQNPSTEASTEATEPPETEEPAVTTEIIQTTEDILHTVEDGDTLISLAKKYETTPENIAGWNALEDPHFLTVGQTIVVGARRVETVYEITEPVTEPPQVRSELDAVQGYDNASYGWSYPATKEIEEFINEYNAYSKMPSPDQELILTFDCGAVYGQTATKILDTLHEKGVQATFFITGAFLEEVPNTVQRILSEGHTIGNHTFEHRNGPQTISTDGVLALETDLLKLEAEFTNLTGEKIAPLTRPPEGLWSEQSLEVYRQLGYTTIFWDNAYHDWEVDNQMEPDKALQLLKDQTRDGGVLLLHSSSETNAQILGDYIDWAKAQGYAFISANQITQ